MLLQIIALHALIGLGLAYIFYRYAVAYWFRIDRLWKVLVVVAVGQVWLPLIVMLAAAWYAVRLIGWYHLRSDARTSRRTSSTQTLR